MAPKTFLLQISKLQNTFSKIDSGNSASLQIENGSESLLSSELGNGDKIIISLDNQVFYGLTVVTTNEETITMTKNFEIEKSIDIRLGEEGKLLKINKEEYESICNLLFSDLVSTHLIGRPTGSDNLAFDNLEDKFANWFISKDGQGKNYFSKQFSSNKDLLLTELTECNEIYSKQFGQSLFELEANDIEEFIQELEENLYLKSGAFFEYSFSKSTHRPRAILGKKNYIQFLKQLIGKLNTALKNSPLAAPYNKIYFGAPGTGKSYQITKDLKSIDQVFQTRITFHPEFDNSSFIGGYKPISDESGNIKYNFVPQTFTEIFVKACNDPEHQYYLIIEEINRGNCAEIFGETFQLLDRNPEYSISPSYELARYLDENIVIDKHYENGRMTLPSNLSILATMNTSDQSLFPMDSAFKRRWDWEYIPINYDMDNNPSAEFNVKLEDGRAFSWIAFIKKVNNEYIKPNANLGMDKCIGNYFIQSNDGTITLKEFINKAVFYLWNDVFKDEDEHIFEENSFYEDFFPIETNGSQKVVAMIEMLGLSLAPKKD
jgi:hypothetical protein